MIIAIDGPAASGKGTLGKRLAHHYGYRHLDTGVIYRAVAYALMQSGHDLRDEAAAVAAAAAPPRPSPPPPSAPADDEEEQESNNEDESLLAKAQALMDKITSSPDNPNPNVIHALSSILETQESRFISFSYMLGLVC